MPGTPINRLPYQAGSPGTPAAMAAGSAVLVTLWHVLDSNVSAQITDSGLDLVNIAGQDWTQIKERPAEWANLGIENFGTNNVGITQFVGVLNSASAGTETISATYDIGTVYMAVDEIPDVDPNYPLAQFAYTGNAAGGAGINAAMPFTPLAGEKTLAAAIARDVQSGETISAYTNYTALTTDQATGQRAVKNTQYADGADGANYGYILSGAMGVDNGAAIRAATFRADLGGLPPPSPLAIYQHTTSSASHVTASISPTDANSLVCVRIVINDATTARAVSSITLGGTLVMTDALAQVADSGAFGSRNVRTVWWVGRFASGSGALTINLDGVAGLVGAQVVEINSADIDFSDPVGAVEQAGVASVANNVLFPAAGALNATPADTSVILAGFAAYGAANFGPADPIDSRVSFWGVDVATQSEGQAQTNFLTHNPGVVGTVVGGYFGDDATSQSGGAAVAAIEIKAVPASAAPVFDSGPTVDQVTGTGARVRATGSVA